MSDPHFGFTSSPDSAHSPGTSVRDDGSPEPLRIDLGETPRAAGPAGREGIDSDADLLFLTAAITLNTGHGRSSHATGTTDYAGSTLIVSG